MEATEEEEEDRVIAAAAFSLVATAPTESILAGPGTWQGPIGYLGPGCPTQLRWEYRALMEARDLAVANEQTFHRVFSTVFSTHLKFPRQD